MAPLRTASPTQGIMADGPGLRKLVLVLEIRDRGDRYLKEVVVGGQSETWQTLIGKGY